MARDWKYRKKNRMCHSDGSISKDSHEFLPKRSDTRSFANEMSMLNGKAMQHMSTFWMFSAYRYYAHSVSYHAVKQEVETRHNFFFKGGRK